MIYPTCVMRGQLDKAFSFFSVFLQIFDFWILDFLVLFYFISSFDFLLYFLAIYEIITRPFWYQFFLLELIGYPV